MLVALAATLAVAPSEAALKKYNFNNRSCSQQANQDPDCIVFANPGPPTPGSVILLSEEVPGSPRLRKLVDTGNVTITVDVPSLAGTIFLSNADRTGPGVTKYLYKSRDADAGPIFTGTGGTGAGQTVRWGLTTGWSVTGAQWCNSEPIAVICTFADRMDEDTVDPPDEAAAFGGAYDLGTWYFHGTGFTSQGFIQQYFTTDFGNNMFIYRGNLVRDGTVPALELLGIGVLGLSLATGGAVALRRKKN
jgi:hypothetical protein